MSSIFTTTSTSGQLVSFGSESASVPGVDRISLLRRAVEAHDASSVESILRLHDDIAPNESIPGLSMPLLHLAVGFSKNSPEIVLILLRKGGDPNNTTTDEQLSPMHLSVIYDFDEVLKLLTQFGGDPRVPGADGKTCYDLAKENVENSMDEKCFLYFYKKSLYFRKSIKPSDSVALAWRSHHSQSLMSMSGQSQSDIQSCEESEGGEGFVTCESDFEQMVVPLPPASVPSTPTPNGNDDSLQLKTPTNKNVESQVRDNSQEVSKSNSSTSSSFFTEMKSESESQLCNQFSYLMTDDESNCNYSSDDGKLSTIDEESAITASYQRRLGYDSLEDRTISSLSISSAEPSCANSTPPIQPPPSRSELIKLQTAMKSIHIPVTPSTYRVLNKYANEQSKLKQVLSPKPGSQSFSSELKLSIENLYLIDEWGNLKIELIQSCTPTTKTSKSFYNYLLLDPKVIKKTNFSGNHLKSDVIRNPDKFETFLKSIFYIGKGCGKRPIQHLVDAKEKYIPGNKKLSNEDKLNKILEIWKSGLGVIVVSVFHYSSEREANVNEAGMIDAVGLNVLSNIKKGSYGGTIATSWPQKTKNQFGSFLLYKAFCAFAVSEHRSFYPNDV